MKKIFFINLLFFILLLTSCVSKTANDILEKFPHKKKLDVNKENNR